MIARFMGYALGRTDKHSAAGMAAGPDPQVSTLAAGKRASSQLEGLSSRT